MASTREAGTRVVGERALLVETGRPAATASWVRAAAREAGLAVVDVVPAARTVLITVATTRAVDGARRLLADLPDDLPEHVPVGAAPVIVPVRFDGPDLHSVGERTGLGTDAVVRLLLDAELVVQFCGFSPGFAYLTGVPTQLHLPRRADPRARVPAGSVALADEYAAVYPRESPGGWHLVGTTPQVMFDVDRDPPALLVAGVRVRFVEA